MSDDAAMNLFVKIHGSRRNGVRHLKCEDVIHTLTRMDHRGWSMFHKKVNPPIHLCFSKLRETFNFGWCLNLSATSGCDNSWTTPLHASSGISPMSLNMS